MLRGKAARVCAMRDCPTLPGRKDTKGGNRDLFSPGPSFATQGQAGGSLQPPQSPYLGTLGCPWLSGRGQALQHYRHKDLSSQRITSSSGSPPAHSRCPKEQSRSHRLWDPHLAASGWPAAAPQPPRGSQAANPPGAPPDRDQPQGWGLRAPGGGCADPGTSRGPPPGAAQPGCLLLGGRAEPPGDRYGSPESSGTHLARRS